MASKKFKGPRCVYCGTNASSTADHVFARQFFLEEHRADLPKVPACGSCNGKKAALEHYLATVLPFGGRHQHSYRTLAEMVPRRLAKNQKLRNVLRSTMKKMWVNYNGVDIQVSGVPVDHRSVLQLFDYIVRGLIWFHWQEYLQAGDRVRVCANSPALERRFDALAAGVPKTAHVVAVESAGGALQYEGYRLEDAQGFTAWRIRMYGGLTFTDPSSGETSSSIGALTGPRLANDPSEGEAR